MLAVAVSARASTADPFDRGYVVPRASDLAVAGNARRGSRPMAEHRVMSRHLLAGRITGRRDATNRTQTDKNQRSAVGVGSGMRFPREKAHTTRDDREPAVSPGLSPCDNAPDATLLRSP